MTRAGCLCCSEAEISEDNCAGTVVDMATIYHTKGQQQQWPAAERVNNGANVAR